MAPDIMAFIMLVIVVAAIIIGIPVAFTLGCIPIFIGYLFMGERIFPTMVMQTWGMLIDFSFVATPLFILMGAILEKSGMAEDLYEAFYNIFGGLKGGLAIATIAMATVFGACTGIVGAGVITIGLIALPSMLSRGYEKKLVAGSVMVGGGLGVTIPPSIMLIIYGATAGVSISKLFMAAIIPGVFMGLTYMIYVFFKVKRNPEMGPPINPAEQIHGLKLFALVIKSLCPPLFLILVVMGSIFFGVVSPSEAGAMGCLGAFILMFFKGKFTLPTLLQILKSTLRITSAVLMICLAGKYFTSVFMGMGGGELFKTMLLSLNLGPNGLLAIMLVIVFIMGMLMDWIALIFILVPVFIPIMEPLGIDPLYFGILFCLVLQISNITPPFAYSVFYIKTICPADITISDLYQACVPFALVSVLTPLLVLFFPMVALWLPSLGGN